MNPDIRLQFRYEERDYVRAVRAHYASRSRLRVDLFVTTAVAGLGIYLWRSPGWQWLGIAGVVVAAAFGLLLLAAFTVIPRLAFRREPKFRDEYSLTFSPDGIHFRTAQIDSRLQWRMYSRALIDAQSCLLYYGARQFTVIPARVFQDSGQRQAFEQLLARHIPRIERRNDATETARQTSISR